MPEIKEIKKPDDIISYSIGGDGCSKITFWTDDERLYRMVEDYIHNVVDAVNYRRQLRKVKTFEKGERL